jgi:Tol biopolymer transport system component/DNA-binding winged helix-turn-helix (wHTH) protein
MPFSTEERTLYRFGVFELETETGELRRHGVKLKLQDQPCLILLRLLENAGQTVTREQLCASLWPADTFVDFETGLNTIIKRLRETLADSADNPAFIETVPKRGYRFIAPVTTSNAGTRSTADESVSGRRIRLGQLLQLGGLGILSLLCIGLAFGHWRPAPAMPAHVLNFAQLTSDGQAKYGRLLSDGSRIYFSEVLPGGQILVQVSPKGGVTTTIPTSVPNPQPADISPDETELLILSGEMSKEDEPHGVGLWILPVAGGSAQPVDSVLATDAAWGERAETILYCSEHDLYVVNRDGSNRRKLLSVSGYFKSLRSSPDRRLLRFAMSTRANGGISSIWEVTSHGDQLREVVRGVPGSTACCGAWIGNKGDFLFQWTRTGRSDLWELAGDRNMVQPTPARLTAGPMNFSQPVGSGATNEAYVIGSIPRGELVRYVPQTSEFVPYLSGISAEGVEGSRDGQWLTYTLFPEGTLWRSNLTGSERVQLTFPPVRAFLPRWSPDGKQIAFVGTTTGDHWTTYVIPAAGGVAHQIIAGSEEIADATWLPDSRSIIYGPWRGSGSRGIKLLDLSTNQVTVLPGSTEMWSPRTSPDGRYIAALSEQDSKLMLFDRRSKNWEELSSHYCGYPSWSHDSKYVYFLDWKRGSGTPSQVARIRITDHRLETMIDLKSLDRLSIGTFMSWTGLAPDDSVLLSRNNSTQEIYAVRW